MLRKEIISTKQFLIIIGIVCSLFIGFLIRTDSIATWLLSPQESFTSNNTPIISNVDGYYYLHLADTLLHGNYEIIDSQRGIPDFPKNPSIPPLLSILLALLTKFSPFSLDWNGYFISAVLSLFISIPIFLYGNHIRGPSMALPALLLSLISLAYVDRTQAGFLDTDSLNVIIPLISAYCFMRFAHTQQIKRYFFFVTGLGSWVLLTLWWEPFVATALCLSPLIIALLFFYRPSSNKEIVIALICFTLLLTFVFTLKGDELLAYGVKRLLRMFDYISKQENEVFFNIGHSIGEQARTNINQIIQLSMGNIVVFSLGMVGTAALFYNERKLAVFLLPIALVSSFSILAYRFLIFLSPILALGLGYLLSTFYQRFSNKVIPTIAIAIILISTTWINLTANKSSIALFEGETVKSMIDIKDSTPKNAIIWSWWDEGYPITYWSKRKTINDGGIHSGKRSFFNAIPFATDDPLFAANFIVFYTQRGMAGFDLLQELFLLSPQQTIDLIRKVLSSQPQNVANILAAETHDLPTPPKSIGNWETFFFPSKQEPVYLYISRRTISVISWIFFYGTWDIEQKSGQQTLPLMSISGLQLPQKELPTEGRGPIDYEHGTVFLSALTKPVEISEIHYTNSNNTTTRLFSRLLEAKPEFTDSIHESFYRTGIFKQHGDYVLDISLPARYAVLQDKAVGNSLLNRMFLRNDPKVHRWFRKVSSDNENYQLWEVVKN